MTRAFSQTLAGTATDQLVAHAANRSVMAEIMRQARSWFQHKPSVELAQIIGCDVRTAERYFAGDRTPATDQVMAMLRSEIGVRLIEATIADLPEKQQRRFWREMAAATLRAIARGDEEAIDDDERKRSDREKRSA